MKIIKNIIKYLNGLIVGFVVGFKLTKENTFYLSRIIGDIKRNSILFEKSVIEKSNFRIVGSSNVVSCFNSLVSCCEINIKGVGNELIIHDGVKLRKGIVHLRGNNCKIEIHSNTTFGGVRIVNVGEKNSVIIKENCLFSDEIEIWASDTHRIFNSYGEIINKEKSIAVEENVWVGSRVTILKGVTLGKGCIIGMGSVVSKNTNPKTINVGNPCKQVKQDISWELEY